jgi:RHS repeat-associated protein
MKKCEEPFTGSRAKCGGRGGDLLLPILGRHYHNSFVPKMQVIEDHQRFLIAGSASVQGNQAYGPYGNSRYQAGSLGTAKGFTGQYQDATGLDYYNARYYDPVVGRFLSADIVEGNAVGMDPYAYVGENPETDMDPTGHSNDPFLIYLYFWYASFHPQIVFADLLITFRLYLAGGGVPDIANLGRQLIWEAKTSGDPRTGSILDMGIDFPSDVNILKGSRQAQDYARRAGPGWKVGTLANDPELARYFNIFCGGGGGTCIVDFKDGTQLAIKIPSQVNGRPVSGVIAYKVLRYRTTQLPDPVPWLIAAAYIQLRLWLEERNPGPQPRPRLALQFFDPGEGNFPITVSPNGLIFSNFWNFGIFSGCPLANPLPKPHASQIA